MIVYKEKFFLNFQQKDLQKSHKLTVNDVEPLKNNAESVSVTLIETVTVL